MKLKRREDELRQASEESYKLLCLIIAIAMFVAWVKLS